MIKKLKDILNTYTDEELEDIDIWIDSRTKIDSIWVEKYCINLITDEANVDINNYIDKEACVDNIKMQDGGEINNE